jgi:hypothetical protein
MNHNRSDRLLRSNRPIAWLYNHQQQVFKVLKLAFGIKTQFYYFFFIFLLFLGGSPFFLKSIFGGAPRISFAFSLTD